MTDKDWKSIEERAQDMEKAWTGPSARCLLELRERVWALESVYADMKLAQTPGEVRQARRKREMERLYKKAEEVGFQVCEHHEKGNREELILDVGAREVLVGADVPPSSLDAVADALCALELPGPEYP